MVGILVAGCSDGGVEAPDVVARPSGRWACPVGWVAGEHGGCGPAVLLCAAGGGAAPHACDGVDLARPAVIALPDGGTARGFYRLPDGGIGGEWPQPDGPPDGRWAPDAGITTCAEGWTRLPDGTCDPRLRTDCPEGSAALPGGACTPTAPRDCPAGEYADLGPEAVGARVVHVRAGAPTTGADGSVERPYATLAAGVRGAGNEGWVRVAAGVYNGQLAVRASASARLVGVCAARVTLRWENNVTTRSTVFVEGPEAKLDLRGVTVTGTVRGIQAVTGATLRMSRVVVRDNVGVGVLASEPGSQVEMNDCVIRGTRTDPAAHSSGVQIQQGATLRATGLVVEDNPGGGVSAVGAETRAALNASVVRGTRPASDGTLGYGLTGSLGAVLRATGVVVVENTEAGVSAFGAGTEVTLSASLVRGTRPRADGHLGIGLQARAGAALRVADLLVDANAESGLGGIEPGTRVEVRTSVIRGTHPARDGTGGRGLVVGDGAELLAAGVILVDNTASGLQVNGAGTRAGVSASVVRGTRPIADRTLGLGFGVQVSSGATLRATGLLVEDNTESGVLVMQSGTLLELNASVVRDTRARLDGLRGHGVTVQEGATLRATGVLVARSASVGVLVIRAGSSAELNASAVFETRPGRSGLYGRGVEVSLGASLRASHLLIADSAEIGASVFDGDVRFTDLLVVGVAPSARGLGVGLYGMWGARVEGDRMAVQAIGGAGVLARTESDMAGSRVAVRDLFLRGVRPSTVRFNESGTTLQPEGRPVAYGLHPGLACVIDATRATVSGGGFGFYSAGGEVRVHRGVITGQLDAAGAIDLATPASNVTLDEVALSNNVSGSVVRRSDLPTASSLAPLPTIQADL